MMKLFNHPDSSNSTETTVFTKNSVIPVYKIPYPHAEEYEFLPVRIYILTLHPFT